jgi:hypothetical protein
VVRLVWPGAALVAGETGALAVDTASTARASDVAAVEAVAAAGATGMLDEFWTEAACGAAVACGGAALWFGAATSDAAVAGEEADVADGACVAASGWRFVCTTSPLDVVTLAGRDGPSCASGKVDPSPPDGAGSSRFSVYGLGSANTVATPTRGAGDRKLELNVPGENAPAGAVLAAVAGVVAAGT